MKVILFFFTFLYISAFAQDESTRVVLFDQQEVIEELNYVQNVSISNQYCTHGGLCFALNKIQNSLFLYGTFKKTEGKIRDTDEQIVRKIINAINGTPVEIEGWDSAVSFYQQWGKNLGKKDNPLGAAASLTQGLQPTMEKVGETPIKGDLDVQIEKVRKSIDEGIPVNFNIMGELADEGSNLQQEGYVEIDDVYGHRVTIIGYETDESNKVTKLVILDNNNPQTTTDMIVGNSKLKYEGWKRIKNSSVFYIPSGNRREKWLEKREYIRNINKEVHIIFDETGKKLITGYDDVVKDIKDGDAIFFGEDKYVENVKLVSDSGQNSLIYKGEDYKGNEVILRIPKDSSRARMLNAYIRGEKPFNDNNVRTPKIIDKTENICVVQEYIKQDYTGTDFFFDTSIGSALELEMETKLVDFAMSLNNFEVIGGFNWEQIAWDEINQEWVLLDWDADSKVSTDVVSKNPLLEYLTNEHFKMYKDYDSTNFVQKEKISRLTNSLKTNIKSKQRVLTNLMKCLGK